MAVYINSYLHPRHIHFTNTNHLLLLLLAFHSYNNNNNNNNSKNKNKTHISPHTLHICSSSPWLLDPKQNAECTKLHKWMKWPFWHENARLTMMRLQET